MNRPLSIVCVMLATSFLASSAAHAVTLNFASLPNSYVQFGAGGTLTFQDEAPNSFNDITITNVSGSAGDSIGLRGDIDGVFTIGAITQTSANVQTASMTGSGIFAISDGAGGTLSGNLNFSSISTNVNFGGINLGAALNLTGLTYTGSNVDLINMAAGGNGIVQASFTAPIGQTLSTLVGGQVRVGQYSGTAVSQVPEPTAALSFMVGALIFGGATRRRL